MIEGLTTEQLRAWRGEIEAIVRAASSIILEAEHQEEQSSLKRNRNDLVTVYDVRVQHYLEEELLSLLPDAGFLGEEEGADDVAGKALYYIVDPIDGTTNFVIDYRHSAISVALAGQKLEGGEALGLPEILVGVCYNPYLDEMFTAVRGDGAYLNGERLQVPERELADSVVLFGTAPYFREFADKTFMMAKSLFLRTRDIRRGGAAVLDICYIAAGRGDLFYELDLSPWDYAAAALIAEEAGAKVTAINGSGLTYRENTGVMIGAAAQHEAGVSLYKELFESGE